MKLRSISIITLTSLLITSSVLSTVSMPTFVFAQSLDEFKLVKSKFEPWLWEKIQQLEDNGITRFMTVGVGIDCTSYEHDLTAAYSFKTKVATLLAQEHNATVLYVGKVLSFVNIKVRVPEIKKIAAYQFVDGLSDGEAEGSTCLDVSTQTIGSDTVVDTLGYNGSGVNVSVLDTGIDQSHPDFMNKFIIWRDFINGTGTPYDDNGHGTHCAGIAVGTGQVNVI